MLFNSIDFAVFLPIVFILYWFVTGKNLRLQNLLIVAASYVFYGWWDWRFLSLIIISSISDFIIGLQISKSKSNSFRKTLLITSLAINLGILGFFKYFNFFIESLAEILMLFQIPLNLSTINIILPVGISFYTFQTLSYTIDIYRSKLEPTKDIISFFAFVSFFPQLVAGPIERASNLLKQFHDNKTFGYNACVTGLRLALWGFFKKIVIADNFGVLADNIFNQSQPISGLEVLIGALFFGIQIYADFSGYSDIAIGIARMLGFNLMTNFRTPYFAESFTEFWHRWHISLSTWFRDYVYFPLGGNQKGLVRTNVNLFITFLLSGLWHGANITFLIWGSLHGIMLIIEKQFNLKKFNNYYRPFVILIVILLWIPFRAQNLSNLKELSLALIDFSHYSSEQLQHVIISFSVLRFILLLVILIFLVVTEYNMKQEDFNTWISGKAKITRFTFYYILILLIIFMGNFSVKPNFIYFQF